MSYIGDSDLPSHVGIKWDGNGLTGQVQYGRPDQALVMFSRKSIFNQVASTQAGRRIYTEQDFVRIQNPGESLQVIERPVQASDPARWPSQWAAYKANRDQVPVGTPIDLLFPGSPAIADNCKAVGILTVEQLANLSESGQMNLGMGARDYVNYAQQYLEHASRGVPFHEMTAQLKTRDTEIASLKRMVESLTGQLQALTNALSSAQNAPGGIGGFTFAQGGGSGVQPGGGGAPLPGLPPLPAGFHQQTTAAPEAPRNKGGRPKGSRTRPKEGQSDDGNADAA